MSYELVDALACVKDAERLHFRLMVVVGPSGAGKSALIAQMAERLSGKVVNVNLQLSKQLLDLTIRQRALELGATLSEAICGDGSESVLLDNTEMLFEPTLAQDPIRLLKGLARNRTVVATWNGNVCDGFLTYAEPSHPEYYRTPMDDFIVLPHIAEQNRND